MCLELSHPDLVAPARFREISNPFHTVVIALLEDLQESDQKSRGRKHEYLKVNIDRRSRPRLPVCYCSK